MDWEEIADALRIQNWVILMIFGSASFFLMSPVFTLGILIGGLIIIANFTVLQHTICSVFLPGGNMKRKKGATIAKTYLRLAVVGMIISFLIKKAWVDTVGLCIGLSIVMISIIYFGIRFSWKRSSREAI